MGKQDALSRRKFIQLSTGALVKIGLPGGFVSLSRAQASTVGLRPDGRPRIPPGQTAVRAIRDMGGEAGPGLNPDWRLTVKGEVTSRGTFSWEELMRFPMTDLTCDVHCVTGWTLLDSRWQGIQLSHLMAAVHVTEKARFVIFEAHAGYTANIPISQALKKNVILACRFMDKPLMKDYGAPLRALVPDRYFYKSAKWIEGIKFSANDEPGYWERNGYSNSADPWKEERFE
jgi:DMSO/TMAO reductase YedYZ molybdopterin-dependent catalytic subunit